jgi:hypothetical protein
MEKTVKRLYFFFVILILSCTNNRQDTPKAEYDKKTENKTNQDRNYNGVIQDIIFEYEHQFRKSMEVVFLQKSDLGIQGGDNWLVSWKDREIIDSYMIIYIIKDNQVVKTYDPNIYLRGGKYVVFDIMQDLPGHRVLDRYALIDDYNKDGYDEFIYVFENALDRENNFRIIGYNTKEDAIIDLCKLNFKYIDIDNGPSPIKFTQYRGKEGFQIYLEDLYDRDTAYWGFVSWSTLAGQYEIEEYVPE